MGRASSSKKVARAARAGGGTPGQPRNWLWFGSIAVVVAVGIALIVVSRPESDPTEEAAPQPGDHWHAAYGIDVCGEWLDPLSDVQQDFSGIHTHTDGLIHIHPFTSRYAGPDANLAAFGEMAGYELTDSSLTVGGETYAEGDDCGGEPGEVRVVAWDDAQSEEARVVDGDPSEYAPQDGEVVAIGFVPAGTELEKPPTVARLADPLAAEEGREPVPIEGQADVPDDAITDDVEEGNDATVDSTTTTAPPAEGGEAPATTTTTAAP